MNNRQTPAWVLCDCPSLLSEWEQTVATAAHLEVNLLLRAGPGLNPFLLIGQTKGECSRFGLWVHLRDKTMTALESDLRSAVSLGIKTIFVGDSLPRSTSTFDRRCIGPQSSVQFLERARQITGSAIRYGVVNAATHPADLQLLRRQLAAGCEIAAVPSQRLAAIETSLRETVPAAGGKREFWVWCRAGDGDPARGRPIVLEMDRSAAPFYEELRRLLSELLEYKSKRPGSGSRKGIHASTTAN